MQRNLAASNAASTSLLALILIASCESQDRRLADYAQRATEQQARQNERIAEQAQAVAKQSQEVTVAARDLVSQDALARRDLIQAHDKLQQQVHSERTTLDLDRRALDAERKSAAKAAARDPVIAQAIVASGLILAALLPLLVTLYALQRLPEQRPVDAALGNPLLECLVVNEPRLPLADDAPTSVPTGAAKALPGPTNSKPADAEP